jgi:hypothetical protein
MYESSLILHERTEGCRYFYLLSAFTDPCRAYIPGIPDSQGKAALPMINRLRRIRAYNISSCQQPGDICVVHNVMDFSKRFIRNISRNQNGDKLFPPDLSEGHFKRD